MKPLLLLALLLGSACAAAQTAVDIADDPHYHLLLSNDQVRVFAATFLPNDKAYVRHEHNYLVVTLTDCELVLWGEGASPIQNFRFSRGDVRFLLGGQNEGIRNDRSTECRNITVEFLNPKVTSYYYQTNDGLASSAGAVGAPVDPHVKFANGVNLQAAIVQDVQLLASDPFPPPEKPADELLIPITDVDLRKTNDIHVRRSPGEILWIRAGRNFDLTNASNDAARFATVQLWKQADE